MGKSIVFTLLRLVAQLLSLGIFVLQLFFLFPILASYMNVSQFPKLVSLLHYEQEIFTQVHAIIAHYIPTKFKNYDITRGLVIVTLFIVDSIFLKMSMVFRRKEQYYRQKGTYDSFVEEAKIPENSPLLKPLKAKLDLIETAKRKDRKRLIMDFMAIKSKLEELRRELSFLSIDVVDSTGMKKNEDPLAISADFYRYNDMLNDILKENKCVRFAMTPDGTMACFPTVNHAISAAQEILHQLIDFNRSQKSIKRDFAVRIGINAGPIYFDEDEPLETISDRVIDIAGHLQKHAEPNTIYIAKAIMPTSEVNGSFVEIEKIIDEQKIYRWEPKPATLSKA
jgi:class 3 adenylate cyclase